METLRRFFKASGRPARRLGLALSLDDRFLYVSCWAPGMRSIDVTDPMNPNWPGSVDIGGMARRTAIRVAATTGGPQMVEVSRDGKRVYWTNSLCSPGTTSSIWRAFPQPWSRPMSGTAGASPSTRTSGRVPRGLPVAPDPS